MPHKKQATIVPVIVGDFIRYYDEWYDKEKNGVVLEVGEDFIRLSDNERIFKDWVRKVVKHFTPIEMYDHQQEQILKNIPKEFHTALSNNAYEKGHAYGPDEVLSHLQSLVEMLEKPLEDYKKEIWRQANDFFAAQQ